MQEGKSCIQEGNILHSRKGIPMGPWDQWDQGPWDQGPWDQGLGTRPGTGTGDRHRGPAPWHQGPGTGTMGPWDQGPGPGTMGPGTRTQGPGTAPRMFGSPGPRTIVWDVWRPGVVLHVRTLLPSVHWERKNLGNSATQIPGFGRWNWTVSVGGLLSYLV